MFLLFLDLVFENIIYIFKVHKSSPSSSALELLCWWFSVFSSFSSLFLTSLYIFISSTLKFIPSIISRSSSQYLDELSPFPGNVYFSFSSFSQNFFAPSTSHRTIFYLLKMIRQIRRASFLHTSGNLLNFVRCTNSRVTLRNGVQIRCLRPVNTSMMRDDYDLE